MTEIKKQIEKVDNNINNISNLIKKNNIEKLEILLNKK